MNGPSWQKMVEPSLQRSYLLIPTTLIPMTGSLHLKMTNVPGTESLVTIISFPDFITRSVRYNTKRIIKLSYRVTY